MKLVDRCDVGRRLCAECLSLGHGARCMREAHSRRGQDCGDAIGLPVSGRP